MSTICFTHSRDLDGHCSGAIVKKKYPDAEIIGYDYGEPFPWDKISGKDVIMVDVSMSMEDMASIALSSKTFTWIDHHKSAIDDYADNFQRKNHDNMIVFLRVGSAACELAWEHFFGEEGYNPFAVFLLGTYDVWRDEDKVFWNDQVMPFQYGMRLKCDSAASFPMQLLDDRIPDEVRQIISVGNDILSYQKMQNKGSMKGAFKSEVHGYQAICCNVGLVNFNSQTFSSVFNPEEHEIMIAFCYLGPLFDQWRVSFYTENPDIDCSVLAKKYGGGGHRGAAGCQVKDWRQVISNI